MVHHHVRFQPLAISSASVPERMSAEEAAQQQKKRLKDSQRCHCKHFAKDFTLKIARKNCDDSVLSIPQRQG